MTAFLEDYGLLVLFACVAGQAAGIGPLPGRTALATAAVLAARGHFSLTAVLAVATVAECVGGYVGYWVGARGGRPLVDRFLPSRLEPLVSQTEVFFARRGAQAVFWARFIPGLKVLAAPVAGLVRMPWWRFVAWHTPAAVIITVIYGVLAYSAGEATVALIERYGLMIVIPLGLLSGAFLYLVVRKQLQVLGDAIEEDQEQVGESGQPHHQPGQRVMEPLGRELS